MEVPSTKRRKTEGNGTKDDALGVDPPPQDEREAHPLAQPPPEPCSEAGTPQGK